MACLPFSSGVHRVLLTNVRSGPSFAIVSACLRNRHVRGLRRASTLTKSYRITGIGSRSSVQMKTDTGHLLDTDVPTSMGGQDKAAQPVEHLLAALIGCTQATSVFVGRHMQPRVLIDKMEFDIQGYRDDRGAVGGLPIVDENVAVDIPSRVQLVKGTILVYPKTEIKAEQLKILEQQMEARCPVANMMRASGCTFKVLWKAMPPR